MSSAKDIQRRIKSVTNTKKITRAMEMVAATKMRRAVEAVLRTRPYASLSWETVLNLSRAVNGNDGGGHPLLNKRTTVKRVGIILITSNRGLCGGFNAAVLHKAKQSIEKYHRLGEDAEIEAEFVLMGKKGAAIHHQHGHKIVAEFPKLDLTSEVTEIVPLTKMIIQEYLAGTYDKIMVAYTDFVSVARQVPRVKQILPVEIGATEKYLGVVGENGHPPVRPDMLPGNGAVWEYAFEPSPGAVLDDMIPRLIEVQLFQALLESNASEHSARMNAMHQATEAAGDMVSDLTLSYNKARQAAITREIAEISAGANALKDSI